MPRYERTTGQFYAADVASIVSVTTYGTPSATINVPTDADKVFLWMKATSGAGGGSGAAVVAEVVAEGFSPSLNGGFMNEGHAVRVVMDAASSTKEGPWEYMEMFNAQKIRVARVVNNDANAVVNVNVFYRMVNTRI